MARKNIKIGPAAPAWMTPGVFKVLQDAYNLQLIGSDAKADMTRDLARA